MSCRFTPGSVIMELWFYCRHFWAALALAILASGPIWYGLVASERAYGSPATVVVMATTAQKKPKCIGIWRWSDQQPNCRSTYGTPPISLGYAGVNIPQAMKSWKKMKMPSNIRGLLRDNIREASPDKVYDWAKAAKRNVIVGALVTCGVAAFFGMILGVLAMIIGDSLNPLGIAASGVVGCLGKTFTDPAARQITDKLIEKLRV